MTPELRCLSGDHRYLEIHDRRVSGGGCVCYSNPVREAGPRGSNAGQRGLIIVVSWGVFFLATRLLLLFGWVLLFKCGGRADKGTTLMENRQIVGGMEASGLKGEGMRRWR